MVCDRHLLAGGKTVKELLSFAEEIEDIRQALLPICELSRLNLRVIAIYNITDPFELLSLVAELDQVDGTRLFAREQVKVLDDMLKSAPATDRALDDRVVKPIAIIKTGGKRGFDLDAVVTPAFWSSLEGEIKIVKMI